MAWWFSNNLQGVWLGLVGVAALFYFVPKLTGRDLHSRHLALLTFWMLILFGSWGGIPATAPVPAWMPVASAVGTAMNLITFLAVAVNVQRTMEGRWTRLRGDPSLRFIGFGAGAFVISGLAGTVAAYPDVARVTQFTWLTPALGLLNNYGFFAMVVFGAVYYIAPQLTGLAFPLPRLVCAHFWMAAAGTLLLAAPLAVGGVIQGLKLQQPQIPFADITKATLHFLRVSTVGDLLLVVGHLFFLLNLLGLAARFCRPRLTAAWVNATTTEALPAEVAR
jgi:cytochrome c oxidase cbb3-type subunit 1